MSTFSDVIGNLEAVTRLARQTMTPFAHPKGGLAVVTPSGVIAHLEPQDAHLTHVRQVVKMFDTESFSTYVNRFKRSNDKTTIFADYNIPKIRAVIDYHDGETPDFLHHAVDFQPPYSEQWARWRAVDNKMQSQVEFAEFIEENTLDIIDPPGATFLDLVTGLQGKTKIAFESGICLQDGSNQLTYSEDVEAKGKGQMIVPADFHIGLPVFFGGEAYKARCFLRYRIDEGRLVFAIKINRRLFIEQTAFSNITKVIGATTGLTVLNGWA